MQRWLAVGWSIFFFLRFTYGDETRNLTAQYGKCLEKYSRFKNHVVFSTRCKQQGVVPPSLRIRPPINTNRGRQIAEKASRSFVNERFRLANQRVRELEDEKKWRELGLRRKLSSNDFKKVNNTVINEHAEQVFQRTKKSQQAKLDRWSRQRASLMEGQ